MAASDLDRRRSDAYDRAGVHPAVAARLDVDGVTDNLATDLGVMLMALREARQATGYKG
jgi:hypothetical protein